MRNWPKGSRRISAWEGPLLSAIESGASTTAACALLRVAECQLQDKLDEDPAFKQKYEAAVETGENSKVKLRIT